MIFCRLLIVVFIKLSGIPDLDLKKNVGPDHNSNLFQTVINRGHERVRNYLNP